MSLLSFIPKVRRLEKQNSELHFEIGALRAHVSELEEGNQRIQRDTIAKLSQQNRSLASLLQWIKITHRIDSVPGVGSIRDLLQKR